MASNEAMFDKATSLKQKGLKMSTNFFKEFNGAVAEAGHYNAFEAKAVVYVDTLAQCTFTNTGEPCTHGVDIHNVPDGSANFLLLAFNMQHFSQRFQPLPKRCPLHRKMVREIREAMKEKHLEAALGSS